MYLELLKGILIFYLGIRLHAIYMTLIDKFTDKNLAFIISLIVTAISMVFIYQYMAILGVAGVILIIALLVIEFKLGAISTILGIVKKLK